MSGRFVVIMTQGVKYVAIAGDHVRIPFGREVVLTGLEHIHGVEKERVRKDLKHAVAGTLEKDFPKECRTAKFRTSFHLMQRVGQDAESGGLQMTGGNEYMVGLSGRAGDLFNWKTYPGSYCRQNNLNGCLLLIRE